LEKHHCDIIVDQTFAEFSTSVQKSAAVFQNLGVKKGTNVAIFGENSAKSIKAYSSPVAPRPCEAPMHHSTNCTIFTSTQIVLDSL